jgi:hypothetical protein
MYFNFNKLLEDNRKLSYLKTFSSHVYDIFMEFYNLSFVLTGQFLRHCSFSMHTHFFREKSASYVPGKYGAATLFILWLSMKMGASTALQLILSKMVKPCLTMSPHVQGIRFLFL